MKKASLLPRRHPSVFSSQFKYVPAASTNVAATFARVRAERLRAQSAAFECDEPQWHPAGTAEPGIEVLEAAWLPLPGSSRSGAPGRATHAHDNVHLTLLHGRRAGNG